MQLSKGDVTLPVWHLNDREAMRSVCNELLLAFGPSASA